MIFGDLANWDREKGAFSKVIARGIEYLENTDFSKMEPGAYEIDGPLMYAMVQERDTKAKSLLKAENHVQHIDIQYVFQGEEIIGYARQAADQLATDDLVEQHDAYLYQELNNEMELILHPGNFAVFFPDDLHRPCCSFRNDMKIKKVVIKIHLDLIDG